MKRTMLLVVGGLLLGGIIHIAVVLLVQTYAAHDAYAETKGLGRDREFHVLPLASPGAEPLPLLDPRMMHAVCRFSLADGPVRIRAVLPDDFWSIAIFDRRGRNIYSLNDRSSSGPKLDLAVLTPVQMAQLRQNPPESLDTAIVVEAPIELGFALLRVFVADESLTETATAALKTADCAGTL